MASQGSRSFVVVGLGTFGSTIATELSRFDNHVLGIDIDEKVVGRLADDLAEAVIADGRDEEALREAGVGGYDVAVVAIGEDLEANILCTMNLKLIGVSSIWAKALSRTHHRILNQLGVERVIQPEREIGQHVAQMLHNPLVKDYVSLGGGFHVVDFLVPDELDGRPLSELGLGEKFDVRCLGLMRGEEYHECGTGELVLHPHDKLLLLGHLQDLRAFGDSL